MNALLHIFKTSEDNYQVRTLMDVKNDIWFCSTDIARAVGYKDPRSAVKDWMHERQNISEISIGGKYSRDDMVGLFGSAWQNTTLINEPMLYKFLMRCRAPKADAFVEWVSGTVLPSIRRTGSYSTVEQKPMTVMDQLLLGVAHYKEMLSLAAASGLNDWYTQAQIRRSNLWYGSRKAHVALNAISAKLGYDVKIRANLTSTDECNPTNMYHVSVFEEYARQHNKPFTVPRVARDWKDEHKGVGVHGTHGTHGTHGAELDMQVVALMQSISHT